MLAVKKGGWVGRCSFNMKYTCMFETVKYLVSFCGYAVHEVSSYIGRSISVIHKLNVESNAWV